MAQHLTNAQLQTVMAKTGLNMKPYEVRALVDALERVPHVEGPDSGTTGAGAAETTLALIFPSAGLNP